VAFARFNRFERLARFRVGTGVVAPPPGSERFMVIKPGGGWWTFQVLKADGSGWEDFQVRKHV